MTQQLIPNSPWLALEEATHALPYHDHRSIIRLMHEYIEGIARLADVPTVCALFGSARTKLDSPFYDAARQTARLLAETGIGIITGGGPGIMEAGNLGAREGGALSIGCPIHLEQQEQANAYLDVAIPFTFFAPRKATLLACARAFILFPGGLGTLDELGEVLAAMQTCKLPRVPLLLYGSAFWRGLLDWLHVTLFEACTIDADDLALLSVVDDPREAVACVLASLPDQHGKVGDAMPIIMRESRR